LLANGAVLILSTATTFNGIDRDLATQGKDPDAIARGFIGKSKRTGPSSTICDFAVPASHSSVTTNPFT
jgi:hypothetical protein